MLELKLKHVSKTVLSARYPDVINHCNDCLLAIEELNRYVFYAD